MKTNQIKSLLLKFNASIPKNVENPETLLDFLCRVVTLYIDAVTDPEGQGQVLWAWLVSHWCKGINCAGMYAIV